MNQEQKQGSEIQFWADQAAQEAIAGKKTFTVSSGITPSGEIHIGNLREVLTADVLARALRDQGQTVHFHYIADTFDPLRHVYPFLDAAQYERFVGCPLSRIPCPCEKHESYAEHFLEPFLQSLEALKIRPQVIRADRAYKVGLYRENIFRALEKTDHIRRILKEETGKDTDGQWSPANPVCSACGRLTQTAVLGWSREQGTVRYRCACGHEGEASASGEVKLTWRVDWPARWQALQITVEPFGKDHASKGGSYDTGARIAQEIFNYAAPYPVPYEWISLKGFGDMSSSKGNVVSIARMLTVCPPEVLRYFILKVKPERSITFDPGLPLLNLVDELDDSDNKNRHPRALALATIGEFEAVGIPFKHLITLQQIVGDDPAKVEERLAHTGYRVRSHRQLVERLALAKRWLEQFAPEEVKFSLQPSLPAAAAGLSATQKEFLRSLASELKAGMNGEQIHLLIYSYKERLGLPPEQLFEALYLSLLGKKRGPRAGLFLASLDHAWMVARFQEAARP